MNVLERLDYTEFNSGVCRVWAKTCLPVKHPGFTARWHSMVERSTVGGVELRVVFTQNVILCVCGDSCIASRSAGDVSRVARAFGQHESSTFAAVGSSSVSQLYS